MGTLVNLHELGIRLQTEFENSFSSVDFELPSSFKESVKELGGYKYDYKQYLVHIYSENLHGYIPNQWFVIASFFVDFYVELINYKSVLSKCLNSIGYTTNKMQNDFILKLTNNTVKHSSNDDDKISEPSELEQYKSKLDKALSPLDDTDKKYLLEFIFNYKWWFGGKGIERGDFYISPILGLAKVVNASHSYIADICKSFADNKIVADNLRKYYIQRRNIDIDNNVNNQIANQKLQQIFYGAPGTGKSHTIKEQLTNESVIRTTFHPDSDYASFVGSYKPTTKEIVLRDLSGHIVEEGGKPLTESKIVYEFVNQSFLNAYINAWKFYAAAQNLNNVKKQFLVIEEINRGNCAQIFGDLFQLLDRNDAGFSDYPVNTDADMRKQLKKAFDRLNITVKDTINELYPDKEDIVSEILNGEVLVLPNNFYIWGTMNTSDQSLFPIDSAFKRRWDWNYMPISDAKLGYVIEVGNHKYDWWSFIEKINEEIYATTSSEDKKLGYFFCKTKSGIIDCKKFVSKVIFYLWNDVFKDYEFERSIFIDTEEGGKLSFDKFYKSINNLQVEVNVKKVETFLENLKLKPIEDNSNQDVEKDTEEQSLESKIRQHNLFSFNGETMTLKDIAKTVVYNYCQSHPEENSITIKNLFIDKCQNIGISHIVETEREFLQRSSQVSAERSVSEVIIPNGEKIYVSTQWRAGKADDNFIKFIEVVHENNWGKIEPIE